MKSTRILFLVPLAGILLSGCGGGGDSSSAEGISREAITTQTASAVRSVRIARSITQLLAGSTRAVAPEAIPVPDLDLHGLRPLGAIPVGKTELFTDTEHQIGAGFVECAPPLEVDGGFEVPVQIEITDGPLPVRGSAKIFYTGETPETGIVDGEILTMANERIEFSMDLKGESGLVKYSDGDKVQIECTLVPTPEPEGWTLMVRWPDRMEAELALKPDWSADGVIRRGIERIAEISWTPALVGEIIFPGLPAEDLVVFPQRPEPQPTTPAPQPGPVTEPPVPPVVNEPPPG